MELNIKAQFSVLVLAQDEASLAFYNWFRDEFTPNHSTAAENFSFELGHDDEGPLVEILAHNPLLTAESLLSLFLSAQESPAPTSRKLTVMN